MDGLQERVATVALRDLAPYGFVLAGGQSLQVHGFIQRPSTDLDLFTDQMDSQGFASALAEVVAGLSNAGYVVEVVRSAQTFARLDVSDPGPNLQTTVDMAVDAREFPPAMLSVGPVLDVRDAVANKVVTVFGRGYARDYLDLAAIIRSAAYSREELLRMAAIVDPGFDRTMFREALEAVDRFDDDEFLVYDLDVAEVADVRSAMHDWAAELRAGAGRPGA